MSVKLLTEHNLEFLSLKEAVEARLSLYTCQNATLLEITCRGSYPLDQSLIKKSSKGIITVCCTTTTRTRGRYVSLICQTRQLIRYKFFFVK